METMTAEMPVAEVVVLAPYEETVDREAWRRNHSETARLNIQASAVEAADLAAFLDLLSGADAEYMGTEEYVAQPQGPGLDWEAVSQALGESQGILIGIQKLLSATFAAMDIEDHEFIRVYADREGLLRLVSDHPRREEMETALNSPANQQVRDLYHAAMAGMGLAGGLVGEMAVPQEVLDRVKAKQFSAA